jgi:hypothetical protein
LTVGRQSLSDLASGCPMGGAASSVLRDLEFEQKVIQHDPDGGSTGVRFRFGPAGCNCFESSSLPDSEKLNSFSIVVILDGT